MGKRASRQLLMTEDTAVLRMTPTCGDAYVAADLMTRSQEEGNRIHTLGTIMQQDSRPVFRRNR
ncbi:hypothetical protein Memar_2258 [Methanoculleus marisnigri JR1]|uniref:Uncharacterized protein n=1 Tax=Methanoculleus marisnigri (strain ATCC 35101 / DSM 1498 / JR1) TaxID=368407 RepID=A3CXT1_METMJ|nr:hypothetical protein Memar_2258 [Methanoculleus marisnigri JR1]